MSELTCTKVYRGGRTARSLDHETDKVEVIAAANYVGLRFFMRSKGGGTTEVNVDVGPEDFAKMIGTMAVVDRQATMTAMSEEMVRQIQAQPLCDSKVASNARTSVRLAAQRKFWAAPLGDRDTESFVLKTVTKLISEIEADDKGQKAEKAA